MLAWGVTPPSARAVDTPPMGLVGSDTMLWVFQRQAEPDGTLLLRFAYRGAGAASGEKLRPLRLPPVTGGIVHAAALGQDLHVFFRDGTHKRYTSAARSWDPLRLAPTNFTEGTLPEAAVPLALAADRRQARLYAVVTSRQAAGVALERAAQIQADAQSEEVPAPADLHLPHFNTDHVVVRYEHGVWDVDRPAPAELVLDAATVALLAENGVLHLFYRSNRVSSELFHQRSNGPDAPWSAPAILPLTSIPTQSAGGWAGDSPVLLVAERTEGGHVVRAYRPNRLATGRKDEEWVGGRPLVDDAGAAVPWKHPFALAVSNAYAAVAGETDDRDVQLGTWSLETGVPVEPLAIVSALKRKPPPALSPSARPMLQYTVILGIVSAVFLWRRESVFVPAALLPGQMIAPLSRRALALLIDLTLLFPVWGVILFAYVVQMDEGQDMEELLFQMARGEHPSQQWLMPTLGGVVGIYATILELISGATLGKRAVDLLVVNPEGKRCTSGAILLRNLTRVVEFHFFPLVMLVVLTPGRQRLGDILGRTLVVTGHPLPSPSDGPGSGDPE